jgi:hypothetical protein
MRVSRERGACNKDWRGIYKEEGEKSGKNVGQVDSL